MEDIYRSAWGIVYERPLLIVRLNMDLTFSDVDPNHPYQAELFHYLNGLPKIDAKVGYRANFLAQRTTDILILHEEVLQSPWRELGTILLHELTHCLIETRQDEWIVISPDAQSLGTRFYKMLNPAIEPYTQHTEHFCQVLAQGAIHYTAVKSIPTTPLFPTPIDCVRSALRYEHLWE